MLKLFLTVESKSIYIIEEKLILIKKTNVHKYLVQ